MNPKTLLMTIAITCLGIAVSPQIANAAPALTEESHLGTNGIGPVLVGMTLKEAEIASGRKFKSNTLGRDEICSYLTPNGISGLSFMAIRGIIERVDVTNPNILTLRGAKIGDSETRIRKLYPGQIKATPHPYTARNGGKYLTFYPKDRADQNYRLIFETYKGNVNSYRGGRVPAVDAIEGCS